jgi:hypothetical protein
LSSSNRGLGLERELHKSNEPLLADRDPRVTIMRDQHLRRLQRLTDEYATALAER